MPAPPREVKRMHEPILVINAGSSSIKFSVFETGADRSLSPAAHGRSRECQAGSPRQADQAQAVDHPPRRRQARGQGLALARAARLRGGGKIESKVPRVANARRRRSCVTVFEAEAASSRLDDRPARVPIMAWARADETIIASRRRRCGSVLRSSEVGYRCGEAEQCEDGQCNRRPANI